MQLKKNWKAIETIALSLPFLWLLVGELLQNQSCKNLSVFSTCAGTKIPDFIHYGLWYDLVFLRGGYKPNNAHWISTLMFPLLYFIALFITRNARFSFIFTVFFGEFHETVWGTFEYIYNHNNLYGGSETIFWIALPSILIWLGLFIYYKFFLHRGFLLVTAGYMAYLEAWWIFAKLRVTVVLTTPTFSGLTPYYHSAAVNLWENGGWGCISILAIAYLVVYKRYAGITIKKK